MGQDTKIEWAHHTFNPWIGCTKVSPACDHCYAERWDARGLQQKAARWGPHAARTVTSAANWRKPLAWNKAAENAGKRARVFCASLADVFDNHASILPEWRADLWLLINATPHLDWLLLTKRPQNIAKMLPEGWGRGWPGVWLGTTVENQAEADRRIPALLNVPAEVHFLSIEPLLGPVDMTTYLHDSDCELLGGENYTPSPSLPPDGPVCTCMPPRERTVDWVITGGESGPDCRPSNTNWYRSLRDQCAAAGTAFFFKQYHGRTRREIDAKGRALDGVVHDDVPDTGREVTP